MTTLTAPLTTELDDFRAGKSGVYRNVPFAEYLRLALMSQSVLKQGRPECGSMLHLKYAIDNAGEEEPTDAMTLGSALHVAFLEPEMMPERVILWKGAARRGAEWEAFKAEHRGKAILTRGHHDNLCGMVAALRKKRVMRDWIGRIDEVEVSCIGSIKGMQFKGRADALTDGPILDLKKISSADDRTIDRTIFDFGLHIQGYIYSQLFKRNRVIFGFVEESAPHDIRFEELSPAWMKIGKNETETLIDQTKACLKSGIWPGRSESIEIREPAEWVAKNVGIASEITIGDEKAF